MDLVVGRSLEKDTIYGYKTSKWIWLGLWKVLMITETLTAKFNFFISSISVCPIIHVHHNLDNDCKFVIWIRETRGGGESVTWNF